MKKQHNKYIKKDKRFYFLKNNLDRKYLSKYKYGGMLISNPLRKNYKKLSSSKKRMIVRDWIQSKDWDKEISTFRFEKSFLRELL